jgi:hypothetical protein
MNIEDLMREGPHPAIPPNAGHRRTVSWTVPDWLAFEQDIRTAFPNAFFYECWKAKTDPVVAPTFRILGRLDEPDIVRDVGVMFPYPGWEPELVVIEPRRPDWLHHWTWKNYLSPHISFSVRPHNEPFEGLFCDSEPESTVQVWGTREILTSYRRELAAERRIVNRVLRMIDKRSGWAVPIYCKSYADFRAGNGRISRNLRVERCRTSPAVIEWAKGDPNRVIRCQELYKDTVEVWMPLELVPEEWWAGIRRPKWTERN